MQKSLTILPITLLISLWIILSGPGDDALNKGLALLFFAAVLWLTESLHITVTALLIPVFAMATGLLDSQAAFAQMAHPIIFLFLGGYALAAALREQKLDHELAQRLIQLARGNFLTASLLLFTSTAFISMWISNTATTAMMLPLALGLLDQEDYKNSPKVYWYLLLGLAYSANIGGIATLVGSAPNAIVAAALNLDFIGWMTMGLPVMLTLLPIAILLLWLLNRPENRLHLAIEHQPMVWNRPRILVLSIFILTILAWVNSRFIAEFLDINKGMDTFIAITALIVLHAFNLLPWKTFQKHTDWGVLILFGGGLTLSEVMKSTGVSAWLAQQLLIPLSSADFSAIVLLLGLALFIIFLTEVASNTATAALLLPILLSLGPELNLDPITIGYLIGLTVSCAFMLPIATPPNAIVFGSGYLPQRRMMRSGFFLNIIAATMISFLVPALIRLYQ